MNQRVLGSEKPSTCTGPEQLGSFPDIPTGDPRIVQVFITPFGSFSGSGSEDDPGHRLRNVLRHRLDRPGRAASTTLPGQR